METKNNIKMKEKIDFKEFLEIEKRLEIKIGRIEKVERMEGSDKMIKLSVDLGEDELTTVMTNIGNHPELFGDEAQYVLEEAEFPFVTNLKSAKMMGVESHAMIMIPTVNGELQFADILPGAKLL